MSIEKLVRRAVKKLSPYVCARDLCKEAEIFLDANENSFGSVLENSGLERYPDSDCVKLREALARYCGVGKENVIVGNGSDEIIWLALNTFAEKGDNIATIQPSYSMYGVCAEIAGVKPKTVVLSREFKLDLSAVKKAVDSRTKIIFLQSPSAIGTPVAEKTIRVLLKTFQRIVFVDEAYYEFYGKSVVGLTKEFENLVVSRTLSKAWGLASLRVGYAVGSKKAIDAMRKIKLPYNVGGLTQKLALKAVEEKRALMLQKVEEIKRERARLIKELEEMGLEVFPSVTNFVLFKLPQEFNSRKVQASIAGKGIIVRERSTLPKLENCIRVTVGTRKENELFLKALKEELQ